MGDQGPLYSKTFPFQFNDTIENKAKFGWVNWHKGADLCGCNIFAFERKNSHVNENVRVPKPPVDLLQVPLLVVCYKRSPRINGDSHITFLGFLAKYAPGLTVKDLSPDLSHALEAEIQRSNLAEKKQVEIAPEIEPQEQVVSYDTIAQERDVFIFRSRPNMPEIVDSKELYADLMSFWDWFKISSSSKTTVVPPVPKFSDGINLEVLFYLYLMVAYECPKFLDYFLGIYAGYLKNSIPGLNHDAKIRPKKKKESSEGTLANRTLEQQLISIVRIEASVLEKESDLWVPRLGVRLTKLMEHIANCFPFKRASKKKV